MKLRLFVIYGYELCTCACFAAYYLPVGFDVLTCRVGVAAFLKNPPSMIYHKSMKHNLYSQLIH